MGEQVAAGIPSKIKSKTLSYIKYHLKRCLYTLVFTSDQAQKASDLE